MARVLIIGGGVAGPVTAMALQRAGIQAVVYEAHAPTTDEEVGSCLTVATNGIDALRAIDAHRPVLAAGFPTPTNLLWSGSGRRLGAASNGGVLPNGTTAHTIKRARLYRALHQQATARGVRIEYGRRLVDAQATAGGVTARFADGATAAGDLLVGADGVHSATRAIIDPAAPGPRYVGLVNFGGYTPDSAGTGEPGVWHMIFGRQAFFGYVVDPAGGTVWCANVPRPAVDAAEHAATSQEQWRGQLLELFVDDRGPAADLIAAGRLELAADNTHDLPPVPTWQRGPMVIIGDAAHAPSPSSGQGASMAAEDAVVLAKSLRDLPDLPGALDAYERLRRRRVERIVAQGARSSSSKTPGPVGRFLRDLLLPVVFKLLVTDRSLAWMYDHHLDWDTPTRQSDPALP